MNFAALLLSESTTLRTSLTHRADCFTLADTHLKGFNADQSYPAEPPEIYWATRSKLPWKLAPITLLFSRSRDGVKGDSYQQQATGPNVLVVSSHMELV